MADLLVQYPAGTVWPHVANRLKTAAPNLWGTFLTTGPDHQADIDSLTIRLYKHVNSPYDSEEFFTCSVHTAVWSGGAWVLGDALESYPISNSLVSIFPGDDITFTFSNILLLPSTTYAFMYSYPNSDSVPNNIVIVATSKWDSSFLFRNFYAGLGANNYEYDGTWSLDTGKNTWLSIYGTVAIFDPNPPSDPPADVPPFPPAKPALPNLDPWWDPPDPPVPSTPPGPLPPYWATGGGGYSKNLVVSGNNKIYYEPHTEFTVPYTP